MKCGDEIRLVFSKRQIKAVLFLAVVAGAAYELGSETLTLSTYYPAPSGVYNQMITTANTYLARDGDGKVGIGTTNPTAKLTIGGAPGVDGLAFPDGTVQTTAAGGYHVYSIPAATSSWTPPKGVSSVWVSLQGGGGGGGAGAASGDFECFSYGGGGGGAGEALFHSLVAVSGVPVPVQVGKGGAPGACCAINGGAGTPSSFGGLSAAGGMGSVSGTSGGGSGGGVGVAGQNAVGDINGLYVFQPTSQGLSGGVAGSGSRSTGAAGGNGGFYDCTNSGNWRPPGNGGGAGLYAGGSAGANGGGFPAGGGGGASAFGEGGDGAGSNNSSHARAGGAGAGGGGGSAQGRAAGAAGGDGFVVVEWYYPNERKLSFGASQ